MTFLGCDGAIVLHVLHCAWVQRRLASIPGQKSLCVALADTPLALWCAACKHSKTSALRGRGIKILLPFKTTPCMTYSSFFMCMKHRVSSFLEFGNPLLMTLQRMQHSSCCAAAAITLSHVMAEECSPEPQLAVRNDLMEASTLVGSVLILEEAGF